MDSRDIYFSYLDSDKQQSYTEVNVAPSEVEDSLEPIETMFADISDGNLAWTIDGYSILMNPEQSKDATVINHPIPNENAFISNNSIACIHDPIINGSTNASTDRTSSRYLPSKFTPSILRSSKRASTSVLKSSSSQNVNITNMIEEVTAFSCKKCQMLFKVRQEIVDHIKTIHLTKDVTCETASGNNSTTMKLNSLTKESVSVVYLCGICGEFAYNSQELLKQHMINVHKVIENGKADKESKTKQAIVNASSSRSVLENYQLNVQHIQKSVPKIRCSVQYCESRFTTNELRLMHEKCHSDYPFPNNNNNGVIGVKSLKDYMYKCTECDTRFLLWSSCSIHLWTRHKIDIGLHSCSMCTKFKCISPRGVLKHISTKHLTTNDPKTTPKAFLCNICGVRFKTSARFRDHLNRAHPQPPPTTPTLTTTYACASCHRVFMQMQALRKHEKQMHTEETNFFICGVCDYRTLRKDAIDCHLRRHTGEKPHKCLYCHFSSSDHNTLRRHQMRHLGQASYSCKYCPYTTIHCGSYKQHITRKHPNKGGLYTCTICDSCYVGKPNYLAHMREHRKSIPAQAQETDTQTLTHTESNKQKQQHLVSILRPATTEATSIQLNEESEDDPDNPNDES